MTVLFNGQVYLFEFKVVELLPEGRALQQIKDRGYADKLPRAWRTHSPDRRRVQPGRARRGGIRGGAADAGSMSLTRPMLPTDIPSVVRIQSQCYLPDNIESGTVIRARLASAPDTAWVAERDGAVCAYLVGYRSRLGQVGALGDGFEPATDPNCPICTISRSGHRARGLGLGPLLVAHALAQAVREGLAWAALVSVQGSQAFWAPAGIRGHAAG